MRKLSIDRGRSGARGHCSYILHVDRKMSPRDNSARCVLKANHHHVNVVIKIVSWLSRFANVPRRHLWPVTHNITLQYGIPTQISIFWESPIAMLFIGIYYFKYLKQMLMQNPYLRYLSFIFGF